MSNPSMRAKARKFAEVQSDSVARPAASAPSARTVVKRGPTRAVYERQAIHAILDEAFICHVGFVYQGSPRVIPCVFARAGETVYLLAALKAPDTVVKRVSMSL